MPLFEGTRREPFVLAFCLAHSREPATLEPLTDYKSIGKAVKVWSKRLGATVAELDSACARLNAYVGDNNPPPSELSPSEIAQAKAEGREPGELDDARKSWGHAVGDLMAAHGFGFEYWTWRVEQDTALHMLAVARAVDAAEAGAPTPPDPNDPLMRAIGCMRAAIVEILKSRGFTIDAEGVATPPAGLKREVSIV